MGWLTGWDYRKAITLSRASGAVINYQMELLLGESSGSATQISGCENTTNWTGSNATLSNVAGIEGTNCLKIAGSGTDAFGSYAVQSGYRDWSNTPVITFQQKRDGNTQTSGQVFIFSGSAYQYYGFTMADSWTEITIDKEKPAGVSGVVNWANITAIRFDANYSGTNLYIDNIRRNPRVHCEGECLSTFNDLRFTTSDGTTLLDYWIESLSGSTPNQIARLWIEFDSIGTGDTTFYMYYGKSDASAVSSGANTFIFFDNFERGSNGDAVGGNWTVTLGSCTISTDHAFGSGTRCCKLAGHADYSSMYATLADTPDGNLALRFKEWKETAVVNGINMYLNGPVGYKNTNMYVDASELLRGPSAVSFGITVSADAWHYLEQKNFAWALSTYDIDYNGSAVKTGAAMGGAVTEANTKRVGFMCADTNVGRDVYIDNVFVRNWRSTGPAWGTWGDVEEPLSFNVAADALDIASSIVGGFHPELKLVASALEIGITTVASIQLGIIMPGSPISVGITCEGEYIQGELFTDGIISISTSIDSLYIPGLLMSTSACVPLPVTLTGLMTIIPILPAGWLIDKGYTWAAFVPGNFRTTPQEGPWDLVEQENKFGYNNNPRFTEVATKKHLPCGHWHKVPSYYAKKYVIDGAPLPLDRYTDTRISDDGHYMTVVSGYVAGGVDTGKIYTSQDYGVTWTCVRSGSVRFENVRMSKNGKYQFAWGVDNVAQKYYMYSSSDYGATWGLFSTIVYGKGIHKEVLLSDDGEVQWVINDSSIDPRSLLSRDFGVSWTAVNTVGQNVALYAMSPNGSYLIFKTNTANKWYRSVSGLGWTSFTESFGTATDTIRITDEGILYAYALGGYVASVWKSTDLGESWTLLDGLTGDYIPDGPFGMTPGCDTIIFTCDNGTSVWDLKASDDSGVTWGQDVCNVSNVCSTDIAVSDDGVYALYCTQRYIYMSHNNGLSWRIAYYDPTALLYTYTSPINCAMSGDGKYMIAMIIMDSTPNNVKIMFSHNYGAGWKNYSQYEIEIDNQLVIDEILDETVIWPMP